MKTYTNALSNTLLYKMKKFLFIFIIFLCGQLKAQEDPNEHIFEPERLVTQKDTMTVTGNVMGVFNELDGDYHIRLRMDSSYVKLSKKNFTKQDSCIILEIVCAHQAIFPISCTCKGYISRIEIPQIGKRVKVTGKLVFDKRHKWEEIHPVYKIQEDKEVPMELFAISNESDTAHIIYKPMLTREFNSLSLPEKTKIIFTIGKFIDVSADNMTYKSFYYKLNELNVDLIYDKARKRLVNITAWKNSTERAALLLNCQLKMVNN